MPMAPSTRAPSSTGTPSTGTPSTGMPSTGKPLTRALSTSLVPDLPGERPSRQRQALCAERPSPRKSFGSGPPRCPPHGEPWALPEALSSKSLGSGPPHCPSRGEPWALRRGPPHGEARGQPWALWTGPPHGEALPTERPSLLPSVSWTFPLSHSCHLSGDMMGLLRLMAACVRRVQDVAVAEAQDT